MCAKFWFNAIIYAEVVANKLFSAGKPLVPGLKLLENNKIEFKKFERISNQQNII